MHTGPLFIALSFNVAGLYIYFESIFPPPIFFLIFPQKKIFIGGGGLRAAREKCSAFFGYFCPSLQYCLLQLHWKTAK